MELRSARLTLREYMVYDWQAVDAYAKLDCVTKYQIWGPNSELETKNFISVVGEQQTMSTRNEFDLAIVLSAEKKLIGGCRFSFDVNNPLETSIGYVIHQSYWNHGYANEAAHTLIKHIAGLPGMIAVNATCDKLNVASQRVLEKCGLTLIDEITADFI